MKPRFWGKPNQNQELGFDRAPSRYWSRTRWTEDVTRSLNVAVFKLFLTGLLNDSQCDVGGRSGARGKVHCRHLSDLHNSRPSSRRRPWGVRCQREPGCLLPTHTNCRAARHGLSLCAEFTFYLKRITISELSHTLTDLCDLPFYTSHLLIVLDLGLQIDYH